MWSNKLSFLLSSSYKQDEILKECFLNRISEKQKKKIKNKIRKDTWTFVHIIRILHPDSQETTTWISNWAAALKKSLSTVKWHRDWRTFEHEVYEKFAIQIPRFFILKDSPQLTVVYFVIKSMKACIWSCIYLLQSSTSSWYKKQTPNTNSWRRSIQYCWKWWRKLSKFWIWCFRFFRWNRTRKSGSSEENSISDCKRHQAKWQTTETAAPW